MKKVNELMKQLEEAENDREAVIAEHERDKDDFNKKIQEVKAKADADVQEVIITQC